MKSEIKLIFKPLLVLSPTALFLVILIAGVSSCNKDPQTTLPTGKGLYIINEGLFNWGNAEISFYNPSTNEVTDNLFQAANGYSLGDIAQSMYVKDSTGFIVVNNSAKIEVVKLPAFGHIRTITIAGSFPRYFLPLNDSVAYVSELYAKKIWVINYLSGNAVTSILTTGWTEKMVLLNGTVFVQQRTVSTDASTESRLMKINPATNSIVDSKQFLKRDINGMAEDVSGNIWIAMDEDTANNFKSSLLCYDQSLNLLKALEQSDYGHHLSQLCIDKNRNQIVYTDGDLFSMQVSDLALPGQPLIARSGRNFYAVGVNELQGDIYVSDALDFVQRSRIYRYDKNGNEIHSFTAGVISGNFTFNE